MVNEYKSAPIVFGMRIWAKVTRYDEYQVHSVSCDVRSCIGGYEGGVGGLVRWECCQIAEMGCWNVCVCVLSDCCECLGCIGL